MKLPDILEDLPKETEWRWERIGWALMALIVVAELFGAFGGGVLAKATAEERQDDAEYRVRYQGLNRQGSVTTLYVEVDAPGTSGDTLNVTFSSAVTRGWMIRSAEPEADSAGVGPSGATYGYQVDDWSEPVLVTYEYLPRESGIWDGAITLEAGDREPVGLPIRQGIYP